MRKPAVAKGPAKKRLTKAEKEERAEFAASEAHTRETFRDQMDRASALRSKEREFHGLEREFAYYQEDLLSEYDRAKDSKHPRDVGAAREQILRNALVNTGLVPARYAVSSCSTRAASTTGHVSGELDLLFYDSLDAVSLMRRSNVYEVLPVESTYGTIQVKSKVSRQDIRDGLSNIASYKRLKRFPTNGSHIGLGRPPSSQGFGILFAFDTDLDWKDLVVEIDAFARSHPSNLWCNAIIVLTKGYFLHGDDSRSYLHSDDISRVKELQVWGFPDRESRGFYNFYSILLGLLRNTNVQPPPVDQYFRLPFVAGEYSYQYSFGQFVEYGTCDRHGDFARRLTEEKLVQVIDWCKSAEPINWIRATDIAYGKPGDDIESYKRQPGDVRIYNPDALPLAEILVGDREINYEGKATNCKFLAFDSIVSDGMQIWIPYHYELKEALISLCPKCDPKM